MPPWMLSGRLFVLVAGCCKFDSQGETLKLRHLIISVTRPYYINSRTFLIPLLIVRVLAWSRRRCVHVRHKSFVNTINQKLMQKIL